MIASMLWDEEESARQLQNPGPSLGLFLVNVTPAGSVRRRREDEECPELP